MHSRGLALAAIALIAIAGLLVTSPPALSSDRPAQIRVAYFPQLPAPMQFAQAKQTFDAVLGTDVEWLPYRSGSEMAAALAAGEVHIAYSLGHVPFTVAVSAGEPISMVGVAVSYPQQDNCLLASTIDRSSPAAFAGQSAAVRPGSVTHFRLLKMFDKLGVDRGSVRILPVADGAAALAALEQGDAAIACAFGKVLADMAAYGEPLMTAAELDAMGLRLFDVIAVENGFRDNHGDVIEAFLQLVASANDQWRRSPDSMLRTIARTAHMSRDSARAALDSFAFPTPAEQRSDSWMGSEVASYTSEIAAFFARRGQLAQSLDDYSGTITTEFLR